jgi:hypothetical protein
MDSESERACWSVRARARIGIPIGQGTVSVEAELEVPGGEPGVVQIAEFARVLGVASFTFDIFISPDTS